MNRMILTLSFDHKVSRSKALHAGHFCLDCYAIAWESSTLVNDTSTVVVTSHKHLPIMQNLVRFSGCNWQVQANASAEIEK